MKICLFSSPRFNRKPVRKSLAPLGLASLAAVARQRGHEVTAVEGILLGDPRRIAAAVAEHQPDVVGTATVTQDRLACIEAIGEVRRACPDAMLVVGGSHFTHSAPDALENIPQIDAVVMGEGERTFLELLDRLGDGERRDLGSIAGLAWRDGEGRPVVNEPRDLIRDLDSLPMPAWDLFGPDRYSAKASRLARNTAGEAGSLSTGVMTSRGCPQRCLFCANGVPTKVRYMNPEKAVDQVQWLKKTYHLTGLDILDDNFYSKASHVTAFCEEMLRRDVGLDWWAGARLKNLDADVLRLMKRAGCRALSFGVETGTDEVLEAIRKGVTTADMLEAMETVAGVGFDRISVFLIIGLPGETVETIDRSVAFLRRLRDIVGPKAWDVQSLIGQLPLIFPGTGLEPLGRIEGCLPEGFAWNRPYREPKRYLPLINYRYDTVPHFESRSLPLETICRHIREHHWAELASGRKRRYRMAPWRRVKVALGMA